MFRCIRFYLMKMEIMKLIETYTIIILPRGCSFVPPTQPYISESFEYRAHRDQYYTQKCIELKIVIKKVKSYETIYDTIFLLSNSSSKRKPQRLQLKKQLGVGVQFRGLVQGSGLSCGLYMEIFVVQYHVIIFWCCRLHSHGRLKWTILYIPSNIISSNSCKLHLSGKKKKKRSFISYSPFF